MASVHSFRTQVGTWLRTHRLLSIAVVLAIVTAPIGCIGFVKWIAPPGVVTYYRPDEAKLFDYSMLGFKCYIADLHAQLVCSPEHRVEQDCSRLTSKDHHPAAAIPPHVTSSSAAASPDAMRVDGTGLIPADTQPTSPPVQAALKCVPSFNAVLGGTPEASGDNECSSIGAHVRPLAPGNETEESCSRKETVFSFLWLSDVHIREPEVKLYGGCLSRFGDNFIDSFERNESQEEYNWAVYLSIVAAANKFNSNITKSSEEPRLDAALRFMIHTGDAIDAGTVRELYRFVNISNKLNIPWLNVVGNHDAGVFGNMQTTITYTREAAPDFFPIASLSQFMQMHDPAQALPLPDGNSAIGWLPRNIEHRASSIGTKDTDPDHRTCCHGFDYLVPEPQRTQGGVCREERYPCGLYAGYYSHEFRPGYVLVVLQSAATSAWGEWSQFPDQASAVPGFQPQSQWLAQLVSSMAGLHKTVLVFSHHRWTEYPSNYKSLIRQLAASNSVTLFTGHAHSTDVAYIPELHGYELNQGSVIELPQMGRVVEVHRGIDNTSCLITRQFATTALTEITARACQERWNLDTAKRLANECVNGPNAPLPSARRPITDDSGLGSVECGHVGALADAMRNGRDWRTLMKKYAHDMNVVFRLHATGDK